MTDALTIPRRLPLAPQPDVDDKLRTSLPEELWEAIDHAHGTEDHVYAPAPSPRQLLGAAPRMEIEAWEGWWLPEGHHYDLHIEHRPLENAGEFTGGGNKIVWHITVSPWNSVDMIWTVLRDKRAAPHLIIGGRNGLRHPVVIQCIPFNRAGRALAHPSGPETNRADAIQIEICANVADVELFDENHRYRAFANLTKLINIRIPDKLEIPRKIAREFSDITRFKGDGFVKASGHCGHMHVPGNNHIDPTPNFLGATLMRRLKDIPNGGHDL